jgi:hypothetical protein
MRALGTGTFRKRLIVETIGRFRRESAALGVITSRDEPV